MSEKKYLALRFNRWSTFQKDLDGSPATINAPAGCDGCALAFNSREEAHAFYDKPGQPPVELLEITVGDQRETIDGFLNRIGVA